MNEKMTDEFLMVPTVAIFWRTPIREFSIDDVKDMATSLRVHGQIEPIVCKPANEEGLFEGVCGRLRHDGATYARIPEVLVRTHEFKSEEEVLEWQLAENLHRKELSALDKAQAYGKLAELRKKLGGGEEEAVVAGIALAVEESTGVKPAEKTVRKYLEIDRKIGKEAKKRGTRGASKNVGIKHLDQISRVSDEHKQAELLEKTATRGWTVSKLEEEVDKTLGLYEKPPEPIDTGLVVTCPKCSEKHTLIHVDEGKHRLQKVVVQ